MSGTLIWHSSPPKEYMSGYPIGTGRLAAMMLGTINPTRIALNHEWLWRGANRNRDTEDRSAFLPRVRELLLAGRYAEGARLANEAFGGPGGVSGKPNRVDPYQPAGDLLLHLDHGEPSEYRRQLDLESGIASVSYAADGVRFEISCLAHLTHDIIIVRVKASRPFGGRIALSRVSDPGCFLAFESAPSLLAMNGHFQGGISFRVEAELHFSGGTVELDGKAVTWQRARELLAAVNIGTSAKSVPPSFECEGRRLPHTDWERLVREHRARYSKLWNACRISINIPECPEPTDRRIENVRKGGNDPSLPLLYANFGRYLMIASAANADLPPNLQGKWNEDLNPPWESDYHHDVNLQMNYWPVEPGNLTFAVEPFCRHMERFVPHARKAARDMYGCRGILFPLQTDVWGRCTPESFGWAVWIGAAPWLAQHLWWHYEYNLDTDFLRNRAYPILKEIAAFYEDYLAPDSNGVLQIVPSQSPENRFVGGGDMPVSIGVSSTMDVILAAQTLGWAIRASEILKVDADKRKKWRDMRERLPQLKIGRHGQLQEWNEDFEEVEPGHRHFSHLIGLYPGDELDPEKTPDLWQAARVSLERRLAHSGGHTGWSRAWTACLFARLGDAGRAWEHLVHLITDFATDSLLDLHPPRIFQIDGNFGGTAAVLEMLLQSCNGELHFLPALPAAWACGRAAGLRARGGFAISLVWRDGSLKSATLRCSRDNTCVIRNGAALRVTDSSGRKIRSRSVRGRLVFRVQAGRTYILRP